GGYAIEPRTTITIAASITDLNGEQLATFHAPARLCFVVFPPTEMPSKRRPKIVRLIAVPTAVTSTFPKSNVGSPVVGAPPSPAVATSRTAELATDGEGDSQKSE